MEYYYLGKIVKTHGIKGELRIKSNFDKKSQVFKINFPLYIGESKEKEIISSYRSHKGFDMVTLKGYDNINQVLKYLNNKVYINKEDLKLAEGEYILDDLINLEVYNNDKYLGKVKDIIDAGNNILLEIEGEKNFYIPNHSNFIKEVNLEKKYLKVENIEGLIL